MSYKPWTEEEDRKLLEVYPTASKEELRNTFQERSLGAIDIRYKMIGGKRTAINKQEDSGKGRSELLEKIECFALSNMIEKLDGKNDSVMKELAKLDELLKEVKAIADRQTITFDRFIEGQTNIVSTLTNILEKQASIVEKACKSMDEL